MTSTQEQDTFARLIGIYDQLAFNGEGIADPKRLVGKIAVAFRDRTMGRDALMAYARDVMARYPSGSREWAVFGCVLNVLNPPQWGRS